MRIEVKSIIDIALFLEGRKLRQKTNYLFIY